MYVAKKKRRESIIEYIIYMYQIQDTIRAYELDKNRIKHELLPKYQLSPMQFNEVFDWYLGLIKQMINENKSANGDIQTLVNTINEVNELHLWLLDSKEYKDYQIIYEKVKPVLAEFSLRLKSKYLNDIELATRMLYSIVLIKMKGVVLMEDTTNAIKEIAPLFNRLSYYFIEYERGNIQIV